MSFRIHHFFKRFLGAFQREDLNHGANIHQHAELHAASISLMFVNIPRTGFGFIRKFIADRPKGSSETAAMTA